MGGGGGDLLGHFFFSPLWCLYRNLMANNFLQNTILGESQC